MWHRMEILHGVAPAACCHGRGSGLRVCDLFTNPSRLARLLEAIYAFVHVARADFLQKVIRPALHARTVRWVCEQMLGEEVEFDTEGRCARRGQADDGEVRPLGDGDVDGLVTDLEAVNVTGLDGRTLVGCGTGRTGWGVWEVWERRWQRPAFQAASAAARGVGQQRRCAGTAGAAGQQQAQSETVQPPLNLKVAC